MELSVTMAEETKLWLIYIQMRSERPIVIMLKYHTDYV